MICSNKLMLRHFGLLVHLLVHLLVIGVASASFVVSTSVGGDIELRRSLEERFKFHIEKLPVAVQDFRHWMKRVNEIRLVAPDSHYNREDEAGVDESRSRSLQLQTQSSSDITSTLNVETFYNSNNFVSAATGDPANVCICGYTFGGANECAYLSVGETSTDVTAQILYYAGQTSCGVITNSSELMTLPSIETTAGQTRCDNGIIVPYTITQKIALNYGGSAPYNQYGTGLLQLVYPTKGSCNSGFYDNYDFVALNGCGTSTMVCPSNITETAISGDTVEITEWLNPQCEGSPVEVQTIEFYPCIPGDDGPLSDDDDDDTTTDDFRGAAYYSVYVLGGPENSDDDVTLSEAEYAGLIASVFIALIVGIAATALCCVKFIKPRKVPMASTDGGSQMGSFA